MIASSVLQNLSPEALAELMAAYLYFKSKGLTGNDFARYAASRRFRELARIAAESTPAVIAGLIADDELRPILVSLFKSFTRRG